jgi:hypothetical protein
VAPMAVRASQRKPAFNPDAAAAHSIVIMSRTSLPHLLQALDDRILSDSELGPALFAQLTAAQRELGLLHGDRPTCPFLRPLIFGRIQYEAIKHAAQIIAGVFESVATRALVDDQLLAELGLTPLEVRMARIDPGYARLCVTSRLDAYPTAEGFQFLEYNAENPAGVGDQMQLEKALFDLPWMREFLDSTLCWSPQPHRRLLEVLLSIYREWGGEAEQPQIGIIDWDGVATASEFEVLRRYFESEGYATIIADPRSLGYDGRQLRAGRFRIDIVYKRVIIHEFLTRYDEGHPLARAFAERKVCMVNSFRSKIAHKKAGFAILSDPRYAALFTPEELAVIDRHVPWTRRVQTGMTTFAGDERDLVELLKTEQEDLVLKPNDEYGGHGVVLGWEVSPLEWQGAIERALNGDYVTQRRVPVTRTSIAMFDERASAREMIADFNPFLFLNQVEGGLVRLSATSLSNISSGGGQTALLVVEGL